MRSFKHSREIYIPTGYTKVSQKDGDGVVYINQSASPLSGAMRYYAIGFHGRAQKPDFNYSFKTSKSRDEYVRKFFETRKSRMDYKKSRKVTADNPHGLKVGDILASSWGYDQTNVDFRQVVGLVGKSTVLLKSIASVVHEATGPMSASVIAVKDQFLNDAILKKRVSPDNCVKISSYEYAYKWDGKPMHSSWYH